MIADRYDAPVQHVFMTRKIIASWTAMIVQATVCVMMGSALVATVGKERTVKKLHAQMIALDTALVSCR